MKKNKMMRIASVLLIVTLLSTCAISGTFAKYVTEASGSDAARVAKWGVVIDLNTGSLFQESYEGTQIGSINGNKTTVQSAGIAGTENLSSVVAPGTGSKGTAHADDLDAPEALKATLSGVNEVAAEFKLAMSNVKEVFIPKDTVITDYTKLVYDEDADEYKYNTYTVPEDYYPVQLTLKISLDGLARPVEVTGSWADIEAKLESFGNTSGYNNEGLSINVPAGKDISGSFELSWEWPFESGHDIEDTYLGACINGSCNPAAGVVLTESYDFTASATQID